MKHCFVTHRSDFAASCFCFILLLVFMEKSNLAAAAPKLELKHEQETVEVLLDGKLWTKFNYGDNLPKPYFHPVFAPGTNDSIVRELKEPNQEGKYPEGYDHKHHRGVWIGLEMVGKRENDHWTEKQRIDNTKVDIKQNVGDVVSFVATNDWLDAEGNPLLKESTTWSFHNSGLTVAEIELAATKDGLMLGDTKEGFLAIRMADDLRAKEGGIITNALGDEGEKTCWGKPAMWVDYTGQRDGKKIGVTMFDDPGNFRPAAYHVRAYGLFGISPFGPGAYSSGKAPQQPVILSKKAPLKLRYGIFLHQAADGDGSVDLEQVKQEFLSAK